MDAMVMAKKKVLGDLIKEMRARMVAPGEAPEGLVEDSTEESAESPEFEAGEEEGAREGLEDGESMPPKKGVTITMAAIKKGSPFVAKGDAARGGSKLPSALEAALMGKDKERFKKKA